MKNLLVFVSFLISAFGVTWFSSGFLGSAYSQEANLKKEIQMKGPPIPNSAPTNPLAPAVNLNQPLLGGGLAPNPSSLSEDLDRSLFTRTKSVDGFEYDPTEGRDPFRTFGADVNEPSEPSGSGGQVESHGPSAPLEAFELAQLKILAIIWDVDSPRVIIKDPQGKTHWAKRNAKIGRNNGFIAVIREGEIVVVEPAIVDGLSTATTRVLALATGAK